jgi:hypothetical protein
MGFAQWLKVLDTVSGLAQWSGRLRDPSAPGDPAADPGSNSPLLQLETRLAGVVVAALKEAFDRDRVRMDLERSQMEAERQRAEAALRAELRRQAADRALGQVRLIAIMAVATWMLSAALGVWLPGMRSGAPRLLLGSGWLAAIAALGCAFVAWQHVSAWSATTEGGELTLHAAAAAAPWLLLSAMALTGVALLSAL